MRSPSRSSCPTKTTAWGPPPRAFDRPPTAGDTHAAPPRTFAVGGIAAPAAIPPQIFFVTIGWIAGIDVTGYIMNDCGPFGLPRSNWVKKQFVGEVTARAPRHSL